MKKKKTVKPVKMCAETAAFLDELFGERDVYSEGYKHLLDLLFALQDEKGYGADEQLNDFGKKSFPKRFLRSFFLKKATLGAAAPPRARRRPNRYSKIRSRNRIIENINESGGGGKKIVQKRQRKFCENT